MQGNPILPELLWDKLHLPEPVPRNEKQFRVRVHCCWWNQARIKDNSRNTNRFDNSEIEFHENLYQGFKSLFKDRKNSYIINAEKSQDELLQEALNIIIGCLDE